MMKNITKYALLLSPLVGGSCADVKNDAERPNIIFILADDYGAEDIKSYNPSTPLNTPNIDKLAENGVQFRVCYSTPLSGPSRALLMSGQYPQKTGHWCNNGVFNKDYEDFPYDIVNDPTFYRSLHEAGYTTAIAGKWDGDKGIMPKYFDEACIWPREVKFIPKGVTYTGVKKTDDPLWQPTSRYWQPFIMKNGNFLETDKKDFGPDIFSDFVLDFMKRKKGGDKPIFVYYPMVLPHSEAVGKPREHAISTPDLHRPGQKTMASYESMKNYVDFIVGKIMNGLEEQGIADNTIIVFSSDNGSYGHHGKSTVYEPGVWVPFIVYCPELITPRGMVDELVSHADVFPTLVELANAKVPEIVDGISQVPVLKGEKGKRDHVYSYLASERIIRTHRFLLEKNHEKFDGYFYDCKDVVVGSANEEKKESYIDLTLSVEREFIEEKERLIRLLEEKYPSPKGIPIEGRKKVIVQRAYDKALGLY